MTYLRMGRKPAKCVDCNNTVSSLYLDNKGVCCSCKIIRANHGIADDGSKLKDAIKNSKY